MQDPWPLLFLVLLGTIVVLVALSLRWRRLARANAEAATREQDRQLAARQRTVRAAAGEGDAPALLAREGYEVVAQQVAGSWTVRANGEPKTFGLRADYLVSRAGQRYIAEVKTGRLAPSLSHGATRRQLLEYGAAFDVAGVLLVDADRGAITHVEIDLLGGRAPVGRSRGFVVSVAVVSFAIGVLVGVTVVR